MPTDQPNPAGDTHRAHPAGFELHNTASNTMLTVGPRHRPPVSDDLVLALGHRTYGDSSRRSLLLSRAQVRELTDWLTAWDEHGWDGVRHTDGPTSADIIEHYRAIAVRERIRADHERIDAHRLLHAAIALVPPDCRSQDLDEVALAQGRAWARLEHAREHLDQLRSLLVQGLHDIKWSRTASADVLRQAAGRLLDRAGHPTTGEVSDAEAAAAPLYDRARLVTAADLIPPPD